MELLHFVDYHGSNLSKRNVGDFAGYLQNCYFGLILQEVLQCCASITPGRKLGGRLGQNRCSRGRNLALNGTQGEVGVSLEFFF